MLGVEKFISWSKVAVCTRFSDKGTRHKQIRNSRSLGYVVSKQQVERLM
jgi:hypothetical protein